MISPTKPVTAAWNFASNEKMGESSDMPLPATPITPPSRRGGGGGRVGGTGGLKELRKPPFSGVGAGLPVFLAASAIDAMTVCE